MVDWHLLDDRYVACKLNLKGVLVEHQLTIGILARFLVFFFPLYFVKFLVVHVNELLMVRSSTMALFWVLVYVLFACAFQAFIFFPFIKGFESVWTGWLAFSALTSFFRIIELRPLKMIRSFLSAVRH